MFFKKHVVCSLKIIFKNLQFLIRKPFELSTDPWPGSSLKNPRFWALARRKSFKIKILDSQSGSPLTITTFGLSKKEERKLLQKNHYFKKSFCFLKKKKNK